MKGAEYTSFVSFYFHLTYFDLITIQLPWQPTKLCNLHEFHVTGRELLKKQFCKSFVQNICSYIAVNANFLTFQISVETASSHSNKRSGAIANKNRILIEASTKILSLKLEL